MADLTNAKFYNGAPAPEHAKEAVFQRLKPVLTVAQLKGLFLFGIPLVSGAPDQDGRRQVMTDDLLEVYLERAIVQAETEMGGYVTPVLVEERLPFDEAQYHNCMTMISKHRPLSVVLALVIQTADGQELYQLDLQRLDLSYALKGQLNIDPMTIAQSGIPAMAGSGIVTPASSGFLSIYSARSWSPAVWTLRSIAGFPDGLVPVCVNDLIGTIAAQEILSELAATHAQRTSTSIGVDGYSQSVGGPGPQLYKLRMDELTEKRRRAMRQCRVMLGNHLFAGQW